MQSALGRGLTSLKFMSNVRQKDSLFLRAAALCVLLLLGLNFTPGSPASGALQDATGLVITLERTGCFGPCPIYRLTLRGDGEVVFEGKRFVKSVGKLTAHVPPEDVQRLAEEFKKANYFSLRDKYVSPADGCQQWATDNPSAITSIKFEGKEKSVNHYYGCRGVKGLDELVKLETAIDRVAQTDQWVKGAPE